MFMMRLVSIAMLMLAAAVSPRGGQAERSCSKETICVETPQQGGTVNFFVKNLKAFDTTITLEIETENMRSTQPLPFVMTIPGGQTVEVLTLTQADQSLAWRYQYRYHWMTGSMDAEHDDSAVYAMPYASGEAFEVIQGFHGTFSHQGEQAYSIDWDMPEGTEIHVARGGVVVDVKDDETRGGTSPEDKDYANYVRIRHDDGTIGEYVHLQQGGALVAIGDVVNAGDLLGLSGNTGFSSRPHLHFWVYKAFDGYKRQSLPIVFKAREGTGLTLEQGQMYTAE